VGITVNKADGSAPEKGFTETGLRGATVDAAMGLRSLEWRYRMFEFPASVLAL
jgi:hypothetical protein